MGNGGITKSVFVKAGAITVVIFLIGVLTGWTLDEMRISQVRGQLDGLKIQADEGRVSLAYFNAFKDDPAFCPAFSSSITKRLGDIYAIGEELEKLRTSNKIDTNFFTLKKQYVLYSVETWLNAIALNKQCSNSIKTILYFYPDQQACSDCFTQAKELNAFKLECPDTLVFALPNNLNVSIVDTLSNQYHITSTPSLVVNGNLVIDRVATKEELNKIAC